MGIPPTCKPPTAAYSASFAASAQLAWRVRIRGAVAWRLEGSPFEAPFATPYCDCINMSTRRSRASVACEKCRQRKVRCSITVTGVPCISCTQDGSVCSVRHTKFNQYVKDKKTAEPADRRLLIPVPYTVRLSHLDLQMLRSGRMTETQLSALLI
jgi:hypothetical protein